MGVDFGSLSIGGVTLLALVIGIVEASKRFGAKGKACEALALGLGFVFVGLASAIEREMVPVAAVPWIEVVALGLGGGLAATGLYDLGKKLIGGGGGEVLEAVRWEGTPVVDGEGDVQPDW